MSSTAREGGSIRQKAFRRPPAQTMNNAVPAALPEAHLSKALGLVTMSKIG